MKKFTRFAVVVLAIGLSICGYFVYERASRSKQVAQQPQEQGVPVSVAPAKQANFPVLLSGLGTVQPFNTVTVKSRVDGEIVKIAFKEGDIVKPGDLLARIDPQPIGPRSGVAKKAGRSDAPTPSWMQRYQTWPSRISPGSIDAAVDCRAQPRDPGRRCRVENAAAARLHRHQGADRRRVASALPTGGIVTASQGDHHHRAAAADHRGVRCRKPGQPSTTRCSVVVSLPPRSA